MLYVLLAVVAVIVILLVIAAIRALAIKAPPRPETPPAPPQEAIDLCGEKLAAMVRIPTVSKNEDEDLSEFYRLHEELERLFPLIHAHLEKTVLKGTLLYRWPGKDPSRMPILLMGHQDVVPADDEGWTVPAYSGAIVDGKIYGRGTLDCKGVMAMELQAVEELLAEGFTPACDVYLQYSINEESGGDGAPSVVRWFRKKGIRLAMVIDEGGAVIDRAVNGMDRPYAVIGVTEKGYMDVKITARGNGGHSSTPPRKSPAARLFAFANEIERKRPFQKKLSPEGYAMFSSMAPSFGFGMRFLLGNLWLFKPLFMAVMPLVSPFGEAVLATTCCFTQMEGSDAPNVIAREPYLVANLRTSPHQDCAASLEVLKKFGAKYDLEFEVLLQRDASPVSDLKSPQYAYLVECLKKQFPDVGVSPYLIMGGTDCRCFHEVTDNALRIAPMRLTSAQNAACHSVNENITLSALAESVVFFKEFLKGYDL